MKKIFLALFILSALVSCQDFTAPERFTEQKFYLTGLLEAGKPVDFEHAVFLGKTIPVEGGVIDDLIIFDAAVTLYELDNFDAVLDSVPLFFAVNPFNPDQFGYVDFYGSLIIKAETRYKIEAEMDSLNTIRAVTNVPKTMQVWADSLVTDVSAYTTDPQNSGWTEMIYDTIDSEHPIQIETQDDQVVNLYFEFYCLEEWQDAKYVHSFGGIEFPDSAEEYENPGNGSPRRTNIFYTFLPNENNIVNFSFYQYAFVFYGRYRVAVKSIDDNYLQYLYKPEGYNHGGIVGGIGYFGSVCSQTMFTKIVE